MSAFTCLLRLDGSPLSDAEVGGWQRALGGECARIVSGPFTAVARTDWPLRPLLAQREGVVAAGDVRLDNRAEVERWAGAAAPGASDLEVVLAALAVRGERCIAELLGDFSFVVWDPIRHRCIAARDAIGVKALFRSERGGVIALSSRAASIARHGGYDPDYIADFLVGGSSHSGKTIWAGVRPVNPGTFLRVGEGTTGESRFWSARDFVPGPAGDEREQAERFHELFFNAVADRVSDGRTTWAQLSGGLDSSSVVCAAEQLHAGRIAGTVTFVDTLSDGDERRFSDLVVARHGLRNETFVDYWAWQDGDGGPPFTDEPNPFYPFFSRNERMCQVVRSAGGRVLLSGAGSDHYLSGNMHYLTDLVAGGRLIAAARELVSWSVALRSSFWRLARSHAVNPFLPQRLRYRSAKAWQLIPAWLEPGFVQRMGMAGRMPMVRNLDAQGGSRFARTIANEVARLPAFVSRGPFEEGLEMRFPFLSRPLLEFSLQLPPTMRTRPHRNKWVLRQAMRGVLPEEIRQRSGKGGLDARILWSLDREGGRIDALLREPILADLGCVDPRALRDAVEGARRGKVANLAFLLCVLALETWLAVRAGRWTVSEPTAAQAA